MSTLTKLFRGEAKKGREGAASKNITENPYLNARRTWDVHTGSIINSRQIWQVTALVSLLITLAAVGGLILLATQSRFIPYVVEVDKLGQAAAVNRADRAAPADNRVIQASIASWVQDARMVSFDRNVQNAAIWRVYAMLLSSEPATLKMTDFMKNPSTSPSIRAETFSVGVNIESILQQTPETWEVNWTETVWDRSGVQVDFLRMRGLLTIHIVPPTTSTTEEEIRSNPLGIFIRDYSWSRITTESK